MFYKYVWLCESSEKEEQLAVETMLNALDVAFAEPAFDHFLSIALTHATEHDDVVCLERLWEQGIALSHERRMTFLYRRK